jgi:hypothetical protein
MIAWLFMSCGEFGPGPCAPVLFLGEAKRFLPHALKGELLRETLRHADIALSRRT